MALTRAQQPFSLLMAISSVEINAKGYQFDTYCTILLKCLRYFFFSSSNCVWVFFPIKSLLYSVAREKFWRVGNKERDGEYGACFFPQNKGLMAGQPPLLYCARPGSRIWEASFNGDVLSTQQFKQVLNCPPLPLITYR